MGPGMLGKIYTPEDICFATQHVVEKQGGIFVSGTAVRVDPKQKTLFLESGLPTGPDGGLLVNKYLQNTEYREIYEKVSIY
jgi:hypothetical protein